MMKPLVTSSGFVPTPSMLPARIRPAAAPEIHDSVAIEGAEAAPAAGSKIGWGGKTALMGLLAAGAVMGPLGMGAAHAAPVAPAPTVQVDQSASDVMSHFTSNEFNRNGGGGGGQHPMGQVRSGNTGYRPQAQQRSSFGSFGQPRSFPTQRQSFPAQSNFGRQSFPTQRQDFGRSTVPTQRQGFGNFGRTDVRPGNLGRGYNVPEGRFLSRAQVAHPDMRTTIINRTDVHNRIVNINRWGGDRWGGGDWRFHPYGFYSGDNFWAGYLLGEDWAMMTNPYMFMQQPVYVMSPVTGYDCGQITAPGGGAFGSQMQAQLAVLQTMANPQQDPNQPYDGTAGLYVDNGNFDASNPGQKIEPAYAYNLLNHGQGVFFHPPNGDFEQMQGLGDLAPYLVTQSPAQ